MPTSRSIPSPGSAAEVRPMRTGSQEAAAKRSQSPSPDCLAGLTQPVVACAVGRSSATRRVAHADARSPRSPAATAPVAAADCRALGGCAPRGSARRTRRWPVAACLAEEHRSRRALLSPWPAYSGEGLRWAGRCGTMNSFVGRVAARRALQACHIMTIEGRGYHQWLLGSAA